jgi:putative transcriptional regulator
LLIGAALAQAQGAKQRPEKGGFLVARESLGDPNFFRTVVLLLDYDKQGAMGVIINRPTTVALSDMLPKLEPLEGRSDVIWLGGPVDPNGLLLVVRNPKPPEGFRSVRDDLYTGADPEALRALLAAGAKSDRVRAYAGYAGWGPAQLDREIEQGSWIVTAPGPARVFDPNPHALWRKMIDGALVRFARLGPEALLH